MKETDEIYQEMKDELEKTTGVSLDDGEMALRLHAVAAELSTLWAQVDWTQKQCLPQTASGSQLDLHAAARGLERNAGSCAQGFIRFEIDTAASSTIVIAAGTVCLNAAGLEFETSAEAEISAGALFCLAPAKARKKGVSGNVPADSIVYMALAPIGVAHCHNPSAFAGGAESESDADLRARVLESYLSLPNGSNIAYYKTKALDQDGVAAASVAARVRGLGTVDVVIATETGIADIGLIQSIQAAFETEREICADVAVFAPTTLTVPVSAAISIDENADYDTVANAVRAALSGYFTGKLLGQNILRAKLGNLIYNVEGVTNYTLSQPEADIAATYNQLPVLGTVTVTRR